MLSPLRHPCTPNRVSFHFAVPLTTLFTRSCEEEFYNVPRVSRVGGGIGVMHKTVVCLEKHPGIVTSFQSFEFTDVLLKHSSSCLRLVIV